MLLLSKYEHRQPKLSVSTDSLEIVYRVLSHRFFPFNVKKIQQNTQGPLVFLDNQDISMKLTCVW